MAGKDAGAQLAVGRIGEDDWRAWREVRLAALADNPRARAFYHRQGFRPTGRSRPFPGAAGRSITEMRLDLALRQ
jgi:ribosomal protein S18 acetylase RimI-like enzyme